MVDYQTHKPQIGNQVKHILIILSFLLLSSPVIGDNHKGETLYGWGEYPDYVWKGFGDKDTHPVYKGEVENGEPKGKGIETFPNGEKYVGEFKDGKFHGQGTFTWSNGGKYVGEYVNDRIDGQGTYTFPDGEKYVGEFKDGKLWNGTNYDKEGNILGKYTIGEIQE